MALTQRFVSAAGVAIYSLSTSNLTPMSLDTALANAVAGDWLLVQNGTYSRSASDAVANAGSLTSQVIWEGVNTDWSLITDGRTPGGGLVTTNYPSVSYAAGFNFTASGNNVLRHLNFSGNISGAVVATGSNTEVDQCSSANSSTNAAATGFTVGVGGGKILGCDGVLSGGSGGLAAISVTTASVVIKSGRYTGGAGAPAISTTSGCSVLSATLFNSTFGIASAQTSGQTLYDHLTIVGCSSDGIKLTGTVTVPVLISNCLITDNGGFPINCGAVAPIVTRNNCYRNNTGGNVVNGATDWTSASGVGCISGNGTSDYVNKTGNDFRIVQTSPARNAGLPQFSDIGALQSGPAVAASNVKSGTVYDNGTVGTAGSAGVAATSGGNFRSNQSAVTTGGVFGEIRT